MAVTPGWHVGADVVIASSQFLRGDEANSNKPLPGYWRVDLNSRYQFSENIEGFLLIRNLFDRKYYINADGNNNDRYIDPSTGKQVSINTGRGDPTAVFDLRTTKFFNLGGERKVGVFAEMFNLLNTVNFGSSYTGNGRSASFRQPTGFIPGIGYARQLQLGARFLF